MEEYVHEYVDRVLLNKRVMSQYNYLPVYWTSIGVKKNHVLLEELQRFINRLLKNNPTQRYWTVVQHCEGILGSCGVWLDPTRVKIFATTRLTRSQSQPTVGFQKPRYISSGGATTARQEITLKQEKHAVIIPLLSAEHKISATNNLPNLHPSHPSHQFKSKLNATNIYDRPILASFIGNINTHIIRQHMKKVLAKQPRFVIEFGNYKEEGDTDRFTDLMKNSIFALCPRGVGSTSFRLAEAMQFGCIPVYISDTFSLPFEDKINWDNIIVKIKPTEVSKLHKTLATKATNPAWLISRQNNVRKVYNDFFKMEKCAETILSYVDEDN